MHVSLLTSRHARRILLATQEGERLLKILVYAPDFTLAYGGVIALHKLCAMLRGRGVDAAIWSSGNGGTHYGNPVANGHTDPADCCVIYPEIVSGNPLGARKVVRWLLNEPGRIGGDGIYEPSDLVVTYAAMFARRYPQAEDLYVFDLFPEWIHDANPDHAQRHGAFFVTRKGAHKRHGEIAAWIDANASELLPHDQEPPLFGFYARHREHFYCYDTATFLSVHAVLCGCPSTVVPDAGVSAEEWRAKHWLFKFAVGYSLDDKYGIETTHLLRPWIEECQAKSLATVERLLERIQ